MRSPLLAGVAALFLLSAGTAHADTLPKEILGDWCQNKDHGYVQQNIYVKPQKRTPFGCTTIKSDSYDHDENFCTINKVTRSSIWYYVYSSCTDIYGKSHWNEKSKIRLIDKKLNFRIFAATEPINDQDDPPKSKCDTLYEQANGCYDPVTPPPIIDPPTTDEFRDDWCRRNNWDGQSASCQDKKPLPKWLLER